MLKHCGKNNQNNKSEKATKFLYDGKGKGKQRGFNGDCRPTLQNDEYTSVKNWRREENNEKEEAENDLQGIVQIE